MNRRVGFALSLFAPLLLCGCPSDEALLEPVFGSAEAIATARSAPTVTAQLLVAEPVPFDKSSDFETRGESVALSADQAQRLKALLLDPASYDFYAAKACAPIYGVRLRFENDGEIADVLLCFECDILAVYFDDEAVGGEDFDAISDELRSLMKELFPDDPAIAEL